MNRTSITNKNCPIISQMCHINFSVAFHDSWARFLKTFLLFKEFVFTLTSYKCGQHLNDL